MSCQFSEHSNEEHLMPPRSLRVPLPREARGETALLALHDGHCAQLVGLVHLASFSFGNFAAIGIPMILQLILSTASVTCDRRFSANATVRALLLAEWQATLLSPRFSSYSSSTRAVRPAGARQWRAVSR